MGTFSSEEWDLSLGEIRKKFVQNVKECENNKLIEDPGIYHGSPDFIFSEMEEAKLLDISLGEEDVSEIMFSKLEMELGNYAV